MRNIAENGHVQMLARAGPVLRAVAGAVLAVFACAVLAGCSKATKPKEVKYNIYIGATHLAASPEDSSFNRIYIYDADSLTLLDSIWQAHFSDDLAVSPDGRWLYVIDFTSSRVPRTLSKIDTRTGQAMWSRSEYQGNIHLLANGALLLVGNSVLRSEDGGVVHTLTDSMFAMWGPVSGTKVAMIVRNSPTEYADDSIVRVVDVATREVSGRYVAHLSTGVALQEIYTARLHPDGRRVLAIGVYRSTSYSWFVVGDVKTGQTLFEQRIYRPQGEIVISSDGTLAALTDPGTPAFEGGGVLHLLNLTTLTYITPTPLIGGSQVGFFPGDRRIITAPSSDGGFWDSGPIRIIDVTTMTLEKTIWPTPYDSLTGANVGGLGIGPRA